MKTLYLHPQILPTECKKIQKFWNSTAPAIILSGPVESSKTTPILLYILRLHLTYPNFKSLIVRTKYADVNDSVIATLFNQLLWYPPDDKERQPFRVYGYPSAVKDIRWDNEGQTAFRGVDAHRSKIMGSEWDLIFWNQIEDSPAALLPDVMGRASGRAGNWIVNGERRHQFIGDANPSTEFHHVYEMKDRVFEWYDIMHESNPRLYQNGTWTRDGIKLRSYLDQTYTGVEHERKVLGLWRSGDGVVYPQYDPKIHDDYYSRDDFGYDTKWYLSVDFGGQSPQACGLYAVTAHEKVLFKEIYEVIPTIRGYIQKIKKMLAEYRIHKLEVCWVDHLTEHINQFTEAGFAPERADKEMLAGIEAVRKELADNTLRFNTDSLYKDDEYTEEPLEGKPKRLTDELRLYVQKSKEEQLRSKKPDHPRENQIDHACDHLRYFIKGITTSRPEIITMRGARFSSAESDATTIYV